KDKLVEKLNLHAFETVDSVDDTLEISIPANRYSDAGSHYGMAVVASAIMGKRAPALKLPALKAKKESKTFSVKVSAKKACPRYSALYAEIKKISQSPKWMQDILSTCGFRPINAVVDIMNYVMLETGQPMHAFDASLVSGGLEIRFAQPSEKIKTIDGNEFALTASDLVITDDKNLLAIAGVKGGKKAEINFQTRKIIVESANFDSAHIYKTSRSLNLITDASSRFNHGLSPILAEWGIKRAAVLLKEICGASLGDWVDLLYAKTSKQLIKFNLEQFHSLTGLNIKQAVCFEYLKNLGFKIKGNLVEPPSGRADVIIFEDLAEEIINLHGYEKLPSEAPHMRLIPAENEERVLLKDKIRRLMMGFGFNEMYNYSFVSRKELMKAADTKFWGAISLKNPISDEFAYLRPSLSLGLVKNSKDNLRFSDEFRGFELGHTFIKREHGIIEDPMIGMILTFKKGGSTGLTTGNPALELKGIVDGLLQGLGLKEYFFRDLGMDLRFLDSEHSLRIEASNHQVIGYLGLASPAIGSNIAICELYMDKLIRLAVEEKEYEPLSKFPSVMRDISLLIDEGIRVGELMETIENAAPTLIDDADLIDFYQDEKLGDGKKSLTFRIIFQAGDHTLTDEEVGQEMEKIIAALQQKFDLEIR
ncbi:MAG: phenylalanine--tRNA ligase subunit beta, partial [Patescibacteria group bacterium]